jgi:Ras-related protein Rab-28
MSSDDDQEHYQYKLIVCGDGSVGKSSIIHQFCDGNFQQSYKQTIGLDFHTRRLTLPGNVSVTLQIWDIGGQQIGGKMLKNYIAGSHAVLFVYDVTNPDSFKNLEDWYSYVYEEFKASTKKPLMVVAGNKMDLPHLREVKPERHAQFALDKSLTPFLVSAKTGDRVNGMFTRIAAELAGVSLTKAEVDMTEAKVTAPIVNHAAAPVAPDAVRGPSKDDNKPKDDSICCLQ